MDNAKKPTFLSLILVVQSCTTFANPPIPPFPLPHPQLFGRHSLESTPSSGRTFVGELTTRWVTYWYRVVVFGRLLRTDICTKIRERSRNPDRAFARVDYRPQTAVFTRKNFPFLPFPIDQVLMLRRARRDGRRRLMSGVLPRAS